MARPHQFARLLDVATQEIEKDGPKLAERLELTADGENTSEAEYVEMVRRHWADPEWRAALAKRHNSERFLELALKAHDVPLSVQQYRTLVLEPLRQGLPTVFDLAQRQVAQEAAMQPPEPMTAAPLPPVEVPY